MDAVATFSFLVILVSPYAADGDIIFLDEGVGEGKECLVNSQRPGYCTFLHACDHILNLLVSSTYGTNMLDSSTCGFQGSFPLICCPFVAGGVPSTTTTTTTTTTATARPPPPPPRPPTQTEGVEDGHKNLPSLPPRGTTGAPPAPPSSPFPLPPVCGFSNATHSRIVGGVPSELGAWPWLAALGYLDEADQSVDYKCGGSLVTSHYILTAAHCVHGQADLVSVRLGDHNLQRTDDGANPIEVRVVERIVHPQYSTTTHVNDIAMLKLEKGVAFSRFIHPVCLPFDAAFQKTDYTEFLPFVAGWGSVAYNGPTSSLLLEVQLPVVPLSTCKRQFRNFQNAVIDNRVLCASFRTGGKDACLGDSGGPQVIPWDNDQIYYIIGIVSYGYRCAERDFSGVYTRVDQFTDWISSVVKQ